MPYKLNAFTGELDRTQRSIDETFEIKTDNGSAFPENRTISIVGGAEAATAGVGSVVGVAFTGGGGGGVEFADDEFRVFNVVNTTSKIAHDLSSIDVGATRVIKDANYDIDMSTLASSFTADSGVGVPIAGGTLLTGGAGINTLASGSQILFSADGEALASVFSGNFGNATPSSGAIEIVGLDDISVIATGNTLTISDSGGGGGVEFADDEFRVFNVVNTTAKIAHDLSSIDVGATRVIKDANYDIDMSTLSSIFYTDVSFAVASQGGLTVAGGTNISTSSSGSTLTINSTGGAGDYVNVATGSLFIPAANDEYLSCDTTNFDIQIRLPDTDLYRNFTVKDRTGNATVRNIVVTTASGTIDGESSFVLSANHESESFIYNGTNFEVH